MVDITTLEVNTAGVAVCTCTSITSLPHPSTTKGMHVHPLRAHASSFLPCSLGLLSHLSCMTTGLSCFLYKLIFTSNAAGREKDQFGTRMSAGLNWSLGRMPLPFSIYGERHALWQSQQCSQVAVCV